MSQQMDKHETPTCGIKRPGGQGIPYEPNWERVKIKKGQERLYPTDEVSIQGSCHCEDSTGTVEALPIMQTDLIKPFYLDIGNYGLNYAFQKLKIAEENPTFSADKVNGETKHFQYTKTKKRKTVIIVGAGMSGLVAAYELKKAGHEVKIIEAQHRVGGRVRTYADEYFYPGQWADAGAMRIPGSGQVGGISKHFLTDFYGQVRFNLPVQNFENQGTNGYYFYGGKKYSVKEWNSAKKDHCDEVWPNWRKGLSDDNMKDYGIEDIDSYFDATIQPIVRDIICASKGRPTADDWYKWCKRWSKFSIRGFLSSSFCEIKTKLQTYDKKEDDTKQCNDDENLMWGSNMDKDLERLKHLLPWSHDAIVAFNTRSYSPGIDISLSELLRDPIGQWWKDPMHTFQGGMHSLPAAFMRDTPWDNSPDQHLAKDIRFGATVHKVSYDKYGVEVCYKSLIDQKCVRGKSIKGDAVIITLPLNIIRQLTFDPPLHTSVTNSLADVNYGPSTKIMLQCREKFWQTDDANSIDGGFTKTDLPISQIHYPTRLPDHDRKDRGVLLVYTWKQEALMFGSVSPDAAIQMALDQIKKIHPEIEEHFEVGGVKAWYNDPYAQGAFCMLEPQQICGVTNELMYPTTNKENPADMIPQVYFAGEAISFCNGWIQGALESGLRAAYQFYARNELSRDESYDH